MEVSSPCSVEQIKPSAEEAAEEEESLSSSSSFALKASLDALHADPFVQEYFLPSQRSLWRSLKQGEYFPGEEFSQNDIAIPLRYAKNPVSSDSLASSLSGVHTPETLEPSQVKFPKSLASNRKRAESSSTSSFPSFSSSSLSASLSSVSLSVEDELFLSSLGLLRRSSSVYDHPGFPSGVCTPRLGVLSFHSKHISFTPCFALLTEKGFFPSCLLPPVLRANFSSLKLVDLPAADFLSLHSVYESRYKSLHHREASPSGDFRSRPLQNREEEKKEERNRREDREEPEEQKKKRTAINGFVEGRKGERQENEDEQGMTAKRRRLSLEAGEEDIDIDISRKTRREEAEGDLLSSSSSLPPPPPVCDLEGFFLHLLARDTQSCDKEGNIFPFKMKNCPPSPCSFSSLSAGQKDFLTPRKAASSSPPLSVRSAAEEVKEEEKEEKDDEEEEEESEQEGRASSSSSFLLLPCSSPPPLSRKMKERKASRREGRDLIGVSISTSSGRKSLLPSQLASLGLYMGVHLITSPSEEIFLDEEVLKEATMTRRETLEEAKREEKRIKTDEEEKKKKEEENKDVERREEESVYENRNDKAREKEEEEHDVTMRKKRKKKNEETKRRKDGEKEDREERRYPRKKSSRIIDSAERMLIDLVHSLTERVKEEHALSRVYVHPGEDREGRENDGYSCRNDRVASSSLHPLPHVLANLQGGRSSRLREYVSGRIGKYLHSFSSSSSSLISGVSIGGLGYSRDDRGECLEERYRLLCASLSGIPSLFPRFLPLQRSLEKDSQREEEEEEEEEKVVWPLQLLHAFCSGVDVVQGGEVYVHSEKGIAYGFDPYSLLSVFESEAEKEKDRGGGGEEEEEEQGRVAEREEEESQEIFLKLAQILEGRRRKWMLRERGGNNPVVRDDEEEQLSREERIHLFYRYLATLSSAVGEEEEEKKIFSGVCARLLLEDAIDCQECEALSLRLRDSSCYQDDFRPLQSTGGEEFLVKKKQKKNTQETSEITEKKKKRSLEASERRNGSTPQQEADEARSTPQGAQHDSLEGQRDEKGKKEEAKEDEEEREVDLRSSSFSSSSCVKESRGYIHHLYKCGEMMSSSLVLQHNLRCLDTLAKLFRLFLSRNELHRFIYRFLRRCCSPSSSSSANTDPIPSSSPS